MKKLTAALTLILSVLMLMTGCSSKLDIKFEAMDAVLPTGQTYERCVYSVEINNGLNDADKKIYTDFDKSEMILVFEKTADGNACVTMDLTVAYTSTPPYFDSEFVCAGMADKIRSEVIFNGYAKNFNPLSVKKEVSLQTSKELAAFYAQKGRTFTDQSFTAEFTYPVAKTKETKAVKGKGKHVNSAGEEKTFEIKNKALNSAFDNEQIYYIVSSFMRGTPDPKTTVTALGYNKQYKVFNLADRVAYGKNAQSLSFAVNAESLASYSGITDLNIAQVTVSFSQGQPLVMYYSLDESFKIDGAPVTARSLLMLGYTQKTSNSTSTLSETKYVLKSYSAVKPAA